MVDYLLSYFYEKLINLYYFAICKLVFSLSAPNASFRSFALLFYPFIKCFIPLPMAICVWPKNDHTYHRCSAICLLSAAKARSSLWLAPPPHSRSSHCTLLLLLSLTIFRLPFFRFSTTQSALLSFSVLSYFSPSLSFLSHLLLFHHHHVPIHFVHPFILSRINHCASNFLRYSLLSLSFSFFLCYSIASSFTRIHLVLLFVYVKNGMWSKKWPNGGGGGREWAAPFPPPVQQQ